MKTAPIYGPDRHLIRRKADCAGQLITVADFAAEAGISRPRAYQLLSFCPRYRVTDPDTGARMVMVSIRDAEPPSTIEGGKETRSWQTVTSSAEWRGGAGMEKNLLRRANPS